MFLHKEHDFWVKKSMQGKPAQDHHPRYVVRNVQPEDVNDIMHLASHLNSINLRPHKRELHQRIEHSQNSFTGRTTDPAARTYMFVLHDTVNNRVVGSSQVIACCGTPCSPHVSFCVQEQIHRSHHPHRCIKHRVLKLHWDKQGFTQLGGLVLQPAYRKHPEALGKQLSYVRFACMGMHPEWFCSRVIAELLPPQDKQGRFALWEALGKHFTAMPYSQADALSHSNKEFVNSLFPQSPIYTCLLPEKAQRAIGTVGPKTQPAYHLLKRIGFHDTPHIDPFDGGPHLHALLHDIAPVRQTRQVVLHVATHKETSQHNTWGMVAVWRPNAHEDSVKQPQFIACATQYVYNDKQAIAVGQNVFDDLQLQSNEQVWFLPLSS
ncbi:MAG: arginine N-succinyltransferase [Myxococcota bacterium]